MNPWRGLRDLPEGAWTLFAVALVNRMGTMVLPFLVLYLTKSVGISPARAGLALTLYGAGALVVAPLAGRLSDLWGSRRVMLASLFLSGAILLAFPVAKSWQAIVVLVLALSITSEAVRPANMALLTDAVAPEQRKAAFALIRMAINLGMSVGPAVGGFLATVSFPALFWVDGGTSILAGIVLLLRPVRIQPKPQARASAGATASQRTALRDGRLLFVLAGVLPVTLVFFQIHAAMPLHLVHGLGFRESAFGFLFTINTILIVLFEVQLNLATAQWPHRRSLSLGAFLFAVGFGALALVKTFPLIAATVVVWTVGEMILFPSLAAYVAEICPPERVGEYMGFYTMTFGLGFLVGPWLGTMLLDRYGASVLWAAMFVLGAISAAMLVRVATPAKPALAGG